MATPVLTSRVLAAAATRRLAASSVEPVASGYERGWAGTESEPELAERVSARDACVSLSQNAISSDGDRS